MLSIENQVCSLEYSKQLHALGVKQDSLFYWIEDLESDRQPCAIINLGKIKDCTEQYSAFTVAELGNMFPDFVILDEEECFIKCQKKDDEYKIYIDNLTRIRIYLGKNEAEVRAKMLIYLLKNNLVSDEWKKQWLVAA